MDNRNQPVAPFIFRNGQTDNRNQLVLRLTIAAFVGLLVCAIAILVAWQSIGKVSNLRYRQWRTQLELRIFGPAMDVYWQRHHAFPPSLDVLEKTGQFYLRRDGQGAAVDFWGRPWFYSRTDDGYEVISYGRDGKPGGVGLDCDLPASNPYPPEAHCTLWQFLFEMPTGGIVGTCLVCGLLAAVLTMRRVQHPQLTRHGIKMIIGKVLVTIIGAVIAASFISVFHIPTGH